MYKDIYNDLIINNNIKITKCNTIYVMIVNKIDKSKYKKNPKWNLAQILKGKREVVIGNANNLRVEDWRRLVFLKRWKSLTVSNYLQYKFKIIAFQ